MRKRLLSTMSALYLILTLLPISALATEETPAVKDQTIDFSGTKDSIEKSLSPDGNTENDVEDQNLPTETSEPAPLADNTPTSGTCGKNVTWTLKKGTLTIDGTGEMDAYKTAEDYPWNNFRSTISTVIIGDDVTNIGMYAFWKCTRLANVTIPAGIISIGDSAFAGCTRLKAITVDKQNTAYIDKDGIIFDKSESTIVCYPAGKFDSSYIIPKGITCIGYQAFYGNTSLYTVEIPDTVTTIKGYAFGECSNLYNIKIPNNATDIGWAVFYMCNNLTSITIPNNVSSIEYGMFYKCTKLHDVTIPADVTHIGDNAFGGCNALANVYYGGSKETWDVIDIEIGNKPLVNATIHYNSEYKVYCNGGYESFDVSLEECISKTSSTSYNPQLAHMLVAMCNSVHEPTDMQNTFDSFGFSKNLWTREELPLLTFNVGVKQIMDGQSLVLIVARGTVNDDENKSNFNAKANDKGQHSGFSDAADLLYKKTVDFLAEKNINVSKATFVMTGHSRGAAATNIMAARLIDEGIAEKNVYAYTFACPDTAVITATKAINYGSIYNIGNAKDVISWIPRAIWTSSGEKDGWGKNSYWDKYGRSYWYCDDWKDSTKDKVSLDLIHWLDFHKQERYLSDLRDIDLNSLDKYRDRDRTTAAVDLSLLKWLGDVLEQTTRISVLCPVDITVYSSNGMLIGSTTNNMANVDVPDKMHIQIIDDKKYIYLTNGDYIIELNGTDSGTMEYSVQNINVNPWEIIEEKTFANVSLNDGKKMISYINTQKDGGIGTDIPNVQLFILGSNDTLEKEVLPDGNGTEVPVVNGYTITFNANGGSVEPSIMVTETDGKLLNLPTPTRNGYIFNGWFTDATNGTQITAYTIFTSETVVYAHWIRDDNMQGDNSKPNDEHKPGDINSSANEPVLSDGNGKNTNLGKNTTQDASSNSVEQKKAPRTGDSTSFIWLICMLLSLLCSYMVKRIYNH